MRIELIEKDKKDFIDLLLLGDEQENMIDKYLPRGEMFALYDDDLKSIAVVTNEGDKTFELKNIATYSQFQGLGYGRRLINYILNYYSEKGSVMFVGTGDNPGIISFYESCGFKRSHIIKNFFVDNYDHPIIENGVQLKNMIYLKIEL